MRKRVEDNAKKDGVLTWKANREMEIMCNIKDEDKLVTP